MSALAYDTRIDVRVSHLAEAARSLAVRGYARDAIVSRLLHENETRFRGDAGSPDPLPEVLVRTIVREFVETADAPTPEARTAPDSVTDEPCAYDLRLAD